MSIVTHVYSADPAVMAEQCRRYAVREAIRLLVAGDSPAALYLLTQSARRCARLDNRPLDPDGVYFRAEELVEAWVAVSRERP